MPALSSQNYGDLLSACQGERLRHFSQMKEAAPVSLSVLQEALDANDDLCWAIFYETYMVDIRAWVKRHALAMPLLARESADAYAHEAISFMLKAHRRKPLHFTTFAGAMSYLRLCVNSTMRMAWRHARHEVALCDQVEECAGPDVIEALLDAVTRDELLDAIARRFPSAQMRQLVQLLVLDGCKPRDLPRIAPQIFPEKEDVYRLTGTLKRALKGLWHPPPAARPVLPRTA